MKMTAGKRLFAWLLAAAMFVSLSVGGAAFAMEIPNITMDLSDADRQLNLIYSQIGNLKQNDGQNTWYYTVTDFDHDGSLEFVAATFHPLDRSTNLKVWEVNADRSALTELKLNKDEDESFPDIMTDSADTFHNAATDVWSYMYYDNVVISDTEVYTIKTAVRLTDGQISYDPYSVEHTVLADGQRNVTHTDMNGIPISPEQYNASGTNTFAGQERSSTNFEWLTDSELDTLTRLTDSFSVFMGVKAATQSFPGPKPAALQGQAAPTPAPAPVPAAPAPTPAPQPVYLTITKNPTNETRKQGDTAYFVACANAFDSLTWTFVSPNGGEYSVQSFAAMFADAPVGGQSSTTLSIENTAPDMSGWGAYCTFYYKGQTARTTTAYLSVSARQSAAPSGNYSGEVTDWNYSSVTILVANTVTVTIPWAICDAEGDLYSGAPANVYWDGQNVTYCHIQGSIPRPEPTYGSMSGTAHEGGGGYAINLANGTQVFVDAWNCDVNGRFYDGASCVVYYTDYPSNENIYSATIFGAEDWDPPYTTYDERIQNQGGWAGANYPGYTHGNTYTYEIHEDFNQDGSSFNTVTCPQCGNEVSMAFELCPNCGFPIWA